MSKMCRIGLPVIMIMILRHSKLHMPEMCKKMRRIYAAFCHIYAAYMHRIIHQILHISLHILLPKVPHILRKFFAVNQHP